MITLVQRITELAIRVATEIKSVRTLVNGNAADLSTLATTNKSSLLGALNELKGNLDQIAQAQGAAIDDNASNSASKTYSINKIKDLVTQALAGLTNGAPAALDTITELSHALGDDSNFAASIATALSNRVRTDINNQVLTATEKTNARINIGADITTKEIGNPDTNFVDVFSGGLN